MRKLFQLFALIIFSYSAPDYELDVYHYDTELEFKIEVTCAEGVTDCKDNLTSREVRNVYNLYNSLYQYSPYIFSPQSARLQGQ
jgi:hypothetical protein